MSYRELMHNLDQLLLASRSLWQVKAFDCEALPWEAEFPLLAKRVWQISDDEIDAIDLDNARLVETLLPALQQDLDNRSCDDNSNDKGDGAESRSFSESLSLLRSSLPPSIPTMRASVTSSSSSSVLSDSDGNKTLFGLDDDLLAHFSAHIKGRKWQQITAFASAIAGDQTEILEWCAGKGHLGRLIAKAQQRNVTSLEWQQILCDNGQAFADRWALPQRFICSDAFSKQAGVLLKPQQQAIALHACGDLHVALLRHASKANTASIAISPCCYHLINSQIYQGMSEVAKASRLRLSRHDLQLPLQQSVIANDKAKKLRLQEVAWRLGFDSLQRHVTGNNHYLPIPSIKQSQLSGDFEAFCYWAAKQKSVTLPSAWSAEHYLTLGLARQRLTRRIDLVAHLFRESLEKWLLLDRVCFLQEAGYQVNLTEFCAATITPRNALILAKKAN
ncbi:SAM-dependent methyltransferase [Shewanella mesophila]|uniref:methyltransferase n=1 Tax=Shewanella mesophila TaxID=2864208 RepID=UPI001C662440|nr:methyltransferase [Shewanella mesophila]QYJ87613.1 SAM-dependent methyltransferase [Shewanella mesophila]